MMCPKIALSESLISKPWLLSIIPIISEMKREMYIPMCMQMTFQ